VRSCGRLDEIYLHRNDPAHELGKYIVDVDLDPDVELFLDALEILRTVHRFWSEVEANLGTFGDYEDLDLDNVTPDALAMLGLCIDAFIDALPSSPPTTT
jgi:hypothetical protein